MINLTANDAYMKTYKAVEEDALKLEKAVEIAITEFAEKGCTDVIIDCRDYSDVVINMVKFQLEVCRYKVCIEDSFNVKLKEFKKKLHIKWD